LRWGDASGAQDGFRFHGHLSLLRLLVATVTLEAPGDGKLAKLVADHVLVDEHGNVVLAVVHGDRETHHVGQDHGTARPGLDRAPAAAGGLHLLDQVVIDERAFLEGTWHGRLAPTITNDELLGALVVARLVALGWHAPRGDRVRVALAGLGLAAAVRVVHRVQGGAADGGLDAAPTVGAGLAQLLQAVLVIADFADGGPALGRNLAHLTRTQAQGRVTLFAGNQLHRSAGGACDLRTLARLELDAMHRRADRDIAQRQGVAGLDRGVGAGDHLVAGLQPLGRDDVAALAVGIAQQGDVRGAVRVVFDPLHTRHDPFLVALEVDQAVVLLVATTHVPGGDAAVVVAAAGLALLFNQRRVRRTLVQLGRDHADRGT